jgi:hypothetical protein
MTTTNNLSVLARTANTLTSVGSNGQVLTSNGTAASWVSPAGGQYQYALYTSGTTTWTAPSGVTKVKVTVIGGGGGGSSYSCGGIGGIGGLAIGYYTVSPGTGYTVTVGAGGSGHGSSSGSAGSGGTSSFSTLISATGGAGSTGLVNGTNGFGSNGNIVNFYSGSFYPFFGPNAFTNSGSTTPITYNVSSPTAVPGAGGGVGSVGYGGSAGLVLIEYVG